MTELQQKNREFLGALPLQKKVSKDKGRPAVDPKTQSIAEQNKHFLGSLVPGETRDKSKQTQAKATTTSGSPLESQIRALLAVIPAADADVRASLEMQLQTSHSVVTPGAVSALCEAYGVPKQQRTGGTASSLATMSFGDKVHALLDVVPAEEKDLRAALTLGEGVVAPRALDALCEMYLNDTPLPRGSADISAVQSGREEIAALIRVVPDSEERLKNALQIALTSKTQIIADDALAFLCGVYNVPTAKKDTTPSKGSVDAAAVLAALPMSETAVRAALERQIKTGVKLVADEALAVLATHYGVVATTTTSTSNAPSASDDALANFANNVKLNKAKTRGQKKAASTAPLSVDSGAAEVEDLDVLRAENLALKRLVAGGTSAGPGCGADLQCAYVATARVTPGGLPEGYEGWSVKDVVSFAESAGVSPPTCNILLAQEIDGYCLPELTFAQLKADGVTTGMALKFLRAVRG